MSTLTAGIPVEQTSVDTRAKFVAKTYNTLFLAILAFTGLEVLLFQTGLAAPIAGFLLRSPLLIFGGFLVASWLASSMAHKAGNAVALGGLALMVAVYAIMFLPLLYIADTYAPGAIQSAALVSLIGFASLTGVVWFTRKDFSFLGAFLRWIGIGAVGLIIAALVFGFPLGGWFSAAMVVFAGGAILYDTSNVMRRYPENAHIPAALALFCSVMMLFYYVLRLFTARD